MTGDELKTSFGQQVRYLRRASDMTQEKLAEAVNCSTEYISRIERGLVSPSFEVIAAIAAAIGVEPSTLFDFVHLRSHLKK